MIKNSNRSVNQKMRLQSACLPIHVNIYVIVSSNKVTQYRMLIVLVGNLLIKILFYSILCNQVYGKRIFKKVEKRKIS